MGSVPDFKEAVSFVLNTKECLAEVDVFDRIFTALGEHKSLIPTHYKKSDGKRSIKKNRYTM